MLANDGGRRHTLQDVAGVPDGLDLDLFDVRYLGQLPVVLARLRQPHIDWDLQSWVQQLALIVE